VRVRENRTVKEFKIYPTKVAFFWQEHFQNRIFFFQYAEVCITNWISYSNLSGSIEVI